MDSTNSALLRRRSARPALLFAAEQHSGRGTYGRSWYSPPGGLYFSYATLLPARMPLLGLGICCGYYLAQALAGLGVGRVGVKWPNDLTTPDGKLGGVLAEVSSGRAYHRVVIGIGINVHRQHGSELDRPTGSVELELGSGFCIDALAGALALAVCDACRDFCVRPWAVLLGDWSAFDVLRDRPVTLTVSGTRIAGTARGVGESGALCVETAAGIQRFHSGEARLATDP